MNGLQVKIKLHEHVDAIPLVGTGSALAMETLQGKFKSEGNFWRSTEEPDGSTVILCELEVEELPDLLNTLEALRRWVAIDLTLKRSLP